MRPQRTAVLSSPAWKCPLAPVVLKVILFPYTVQTSLGLKSQQWVHAFHIESLQMLLAVFRTEQSLVPVAVLHLIVLSHT